MTEQRISVANAQENIDALTRAGHVDLEEGGHEAGLQLMPYIRRETRIETGRLSGGWEMERNSIINAVDYAPFQEYGTEFVSPMRAVGKAVERHFDVVNKAFEKEVDDASRKAGFGR